MSSSALLGDIYCPASAPHSSLWPSVAMPVSYSPISHRVRGKTFFFRTTSMICLLCMIAHVAVEASGWGLCLSFPRQCVLLEYWNCAHGALLCPSNQQKGLGTKHMPHNASGAMILLSCSTAQGDCQLCLWLKSIPNHNQWREGTNGGICYRPYLPGKFQAE